MTAPTSGTSLALREPSFRGHVMAEGFVADVAALGESRARHLFFAAFDFVGRNFDAFGRRRNFALAGRLVFTTGATETGARDDFAEPVPDEND